MALGDIGSGIAKVSEGLTNGMVQGMQQNREYQLRDRQMKMQEEQLKMIRQKSFFDAALKALDITPDNKLDGWLNHYNGLAPEYGFPKLEGVKRANKNEYEVKEFGGKVWTYNKTTNKLQPAIDPATNQQVIAPDRPMSVAPGGSLVDPHTGRTVFTAPNKPERPISVTPGSSLVDPATGQPLYTAPSKPDTTSTQARRRITDLTLIKVRLGKTNFVDRLMSSALGLPEGQEMSAEDKETAVRAIDQEIKSLRPYLTNTQPGKAAKSVVRTGTYNGRKVAEYSDGTVDYYDD